MEEYTNRELGLKIDSLRTENSACHKSMLNTLIEHNGRLKKVEQWKLMIAGGIMVLSFIIGVTSLPKFLQFIGYGEEVQALTDTQIEEIKNSIIQKASNDIQTRIDNGELELNIK